MPVDGEFAAFDVIRDLKAQGFVVTETTVSTTGNYLPEDAFWNYLDTRHTEIVHESVARHTPFFVGRNSLCSLLLMRQFGMLVPIVLVQYFEDRSTLHTMQSLAFGVLLKSTIRLERVSEETTTVTAHYQIASSRLWRPLHPILRWMLRRNFKALVLEDETMRTRKMELRRLGFVNVGGSDQTYLNTLNVGKNNIRYAPERWSGEPARECRIDVGRIPDEGASVSLDPARSFWCVRRDGQMKIYLSYCPHEGAALKGAVADGDRLVCPWHGRRVSPCASLPVDADATSEVSDPRTTITVKDGTMVFQAPPADSV